MFWLGKSARERGTVFLYSEPRRFNDHGCYVEYAGPNFFSYRKTRLRNAIVRMPDRSIAIATNQILEQTRLKSGSVEYARPEHAVLRAFRLASCDATARSDEARDRDANLLSPEPRAPQLSRRAPCHMTA